MKGITMEDLANSIEVGVEFLWRWSFEDDGVVKEPKSPVVLTGNAWELGDDMIYEIENCKSGATYLKSREEFRQSAIVDEGIQVEEASW